MKISYFFVVCFLFIHLFTHTLYAQYTPATESYPSPYKTSWADGAISAAGIGLSYWGLTIMKNKEAVSEAEIQQIDANMDAALAEIPAFDRWSAGTYSEEADRLSDIPFYASFGLPFLFLADKHTRANASQIGLLYLETMAITGALFSQVNGRVNRKRPSVYNQEAGPGIRMDDKSQNSFYGGHISATAAATFFTAKVFNDYFPDSPARPYVWGAAAAVPAAVGYLRHRAGKHFLSDNLLGYAIGAGVGVLVPHLHKTHPQISLAPGFAPSSAGGGQSVRLTLRF
jgi:hypothetical protein